uniref:Bacteriophage T7 tail fibre protein-like N-terminal domain-containing protein n=1 Tax=Pseudomonas phage Lepni01 TaxID=3138536 RepID=A0AAU6W3G6_9VIRU
MATTTKTVKTYALNGSLKDFTIPFEYLARKFVAVSLIGATRKELVLNIDFRFSTPTTITTLRSGAWGPADNFDLIEIRRWTSATERLVDFADGSILRAYDLNTAQVQSLHIAEEARDLTADTIGVNNDGHLDARARRIVNLADAVNPGDAVTLRQEQQWGGSALNQANLSAQSAAASQASNVASYAAYLASEAARAASVVAKDQSVTAKIASEAARDGAAANNTTAYQWANNPENVVVNSGQFSAFHWVQKAIAHVATALGYSNAAAASATAASGSATTAASKVADCAAQVTLATTQADRAKTEADKLAGMNDLSSNVDAAGTTIGAGNWKVTFKGIMKSIGKAFAAKFEAPTYTESFRFASQNVTEAPFFVKDMAVSSLSEYRPIIKASLNVGSGPEALSFGILSYPGGNQAAVFHWGGSALSGLPLLTLQRSGSQATFSGSIEVTTTVNAPGGCYNNGSKTWSRADFDPTYKLTGTGATTVMGNQNGVCGVNYQNLTAANQVYNGAFEVRENGLVGGGGAAPGHIYNAPAIAFHWGATYVSKLMMNAQGEFCFGNPSGTYVRLGLDGNIYGGAWQGGVLSTHVYNVANERANAWAVQESRSATNVGIAMSNFRVNSLGCHMLALAHNNSGVEWNEGVAGGNLTGTNTGGTYYAGYTLAGNYVRMGKLVNADGASPDSVTLYMRYA